MSPRARPPLAAAPAIAVALMLLVPPGSASADDFPAGVPIRPVSAAMPVAMPGALPGATAMPMGTIVPMPAQGLALEAGSGRVIALPGAVASVFAADPKVAEVRPASPTSLFIFGVAPGRTTIAALDAAGHPVAQYTITVRPSAYGASEALSAIQRVMPGSDVRIDTTTGGLVLRGQVATPADADEAMSMARRFVANGQHVDNALTVLGSTQVTLRVRIAEMSRTVVRALGVNWQALGNVGRFAVNIATNNALSAAAAGASVIGLGYKGAVNVNGLIDALAQNDLVHVLAEPNLTAMSGQTASFLVGGEFPIPVGQQNGQITVEFKKYGVSLAFVPTVLSSGRISLHVEPEVSQLSSQGAVQVTAGNSSLSIPALTVRRAETTVELGSGQSFAIAGLLQDSTDNNVSGLPGLGEIPILGALFRSNSFQHNQTELVIMVTPYIVAPGGRSGGDQAADRRLFAARRSATPAAAAPGRQRGHRPARPPAGRYRVHRAMMPCIATVMVGEGRPSTPSRCGTIERRGCSAFAEHDVGAGGSGPGYVNTLGGCHDARAHARDRRRGVARRLRAASRPLQR